MPLNEIPKFFHPEIRHLIDFALEDAWRELSNQDLADAASVRGKLATTIVALRPLVRLTRSSSNGSRCTPPEKPSNMQRERNIGGKSVKKRLRLNRAWSRNLGI